MSNQNNPSEIPECQPHEPSNDLVRVFVVEDEDEIRKRLCDIIQNDARLQLAAFAESHDTGRRWLADGRHALDVLLIDLGLPDGDGLDLITECRRLRPQVSIMVITLFGDEKHVFNALECGATGYLLKTTPAETIAEHLVNLHAGGSPITPSVARLVIKRMTSGDRISSSKQEIQAPNHQKIEREDSLSIREMDVLNQIAVGYSTNEIANRLNISPHTVTTHIRRVYQKLQVHTRSAAVFEGQRRGLINNPKI
jgi:DNA-binding NarL/FixJ family response regulator